LLIARGADCVKTLIVIILKQGTKERLFANNGSFFEHYGYFGIFRGKLQVGFEVSKRHEN